MTAHHFPQHRDEESNEWVTLHRDEFQQLVRQLEEREDLAVLDTATEADEPLLSGEQILKDIDTAG